MRSRLMILGALALLVVSFGMFSIRTGSSAQDVAPHPIVGAWRITTYVEGQLPALNLTTFYADDNVLTSNRPVFPPAEGDAAAEVRSAGQGTWRANDDGSVTFTFVVLRTDLTGTFTGQRLLQGTFTVDPSGNSLTGAFVATVLDADGNEVAIVPGRADGTRIVADDAPMNSTPIAN